MQPPMSIPDPHRARIVWAAYRAALRRGRRIAPGLTVWTDDASADPATVAREVPAWPESPGARCLKASDVAEVWAVVPAQAPLVLKVFHLPRWPTRIRYLLRASRARRAAAAAAACQAAGLSAPACRGWIDVRRRGLPARSLAWSEAVPDTAPARPWVEADLPDLPRPARDAFGRALADHLARTYRAGLYHADTKLSNLLLAQPVDPTAPRFWWIDLDCLRPVRGLRRRDVLRNLAQLNGSAGPALSARDRLRFLVRMRRMLPGLLSGKGLAHHLDQWTEARLDRERSGQCGP